MFEAVLEEHAFFKTLDPRLLEEMAEFASQAHFDAGQLVFRENDHADRFFAIESGRVAVELSVPGRESVAIQVLHKDDVLGWSWLFPPYRWKFDARVLEPTRAIAFDATRLRDRCEENHELGYEVMKRMTQVVLQRLNAERKKISDVVQILYRRQP